MKDGLKSSGAALAVACMLFLFALACAQAPTAPDEQAGLEKPSDVVATAKQDTVPPTP